MTFIKLISCSIFLFLGITFGVKSQETAEKGFKWHMDLLSEPLICGNFYAPFKKIPSGDFESHCAYDRKTYEFPTIFSKLVIDKKRGRKTLRPYKFGSYFPGLNSPNILFEVVEDKENEITSIVNFYDKIIFVREGSGKEAQYFSFRVDQETVDSYGHRNVKRLIKDNGSDILDEEEIQEAEETEELQDTEFVSN